MFSAVLNKARHFSVSWARSVQSTHAFYLFQYPLQQYSPIYAFALSVLIPSVFPASFLYAALQFPTHATFSAHLVLLHLITEQQLVKTADLKASEENTIKFEKPSFF
jgi:hypothetical protein